MFTMKLESDPKRIMADGRYTVEEFDAMLRQICLETRFKEKAPGEYYLDDEEDELGRMIVLTARFDIKHIEPFLKKWLTHSDYEGRVNQLT